MGWDQIGKIFPGRNAFGEIENGEHPLSPIFLPKKPLRVSPLHSTTSIERRPSLQHGRPNRGKQDVAFLVSGRGQAYNTNPEVQILQRHHF